MTHRLDDTVCHRCDHPCHPRPDRLCAVCRRKATWGYLDHHPDRDSPDILTDGEWVPSGGVLVWEEGTRG